MSEQDPNVRDLDRRDLSADQEADRPQEAAAEEPADTDVRTPEEAKSSGTLEGQIEDVKQRAREMTGEAQQTGDPEAADREEA